MLTGIFIAGVLTFFTKTFSELEEDSLLDHLNEIHMCALHYIYIPRINRCLQEFRQWMRHGLKCLYHLWDLCGFEKSTQN